ncbi:hypothetical protein N5079_15110 [Planotetraspora sp. A-T 1434]|uniref:hypothetical protein n=1 Tax=Planotetraspora sp. A-T 1434 TaxID=2979219 RepID=UPI0021BE1F0E|nr:hypothetical protein [Planotetraspora sp. A-T 1434]MCT9931544.1 hypothetical protein [Planotetraspora sp. A-T 1434]
MVCLAAVVVTSLVVVGAMAVTRSDVPRRPRPAAAQVTDLGRRIPLGPDFDAPWMIIQTHGCGYPNYVGGFRHPDRQTCRMIVLLGNPGPATIHLTERFPELIDDTGGGHDAVLQTAEPLPTLFPGRRVAPLIVKYGMPKERRPVRLEGRLVPGGPVVRVLL